MLPNLPAPLHLSPALSPEAISFGVRVTARPHPFKEANQIYWFPPGLSLAEILAKVQPNQILRRQALIWLDDEEVAPEEWGTTYPAWGGEVAINIVPAGPIGRTIGQIFLAIAVIVVAAVTTWLTWGALGPVWAAVLGSMVGMAVSIVGNLALNALFPVTKNPSRQASLMGTTTGITSAYGNAVSDSPTYALNGGSNQANKFGPIPKILGIFKYYPNYGANTYTEIIGSAQYLRLYFIWGVSRAGTPAIQIEELKIGGTPLENYEWMEFEHRNLYYKAPNGVITQYGDEPLTLYTNDIYEDPLSILLEPSIVEVRTALSGANEITLDIVNPNGLYANDPETGDRGTKSIFIRVERSPSGQDDWLVIDNLIISGAITSAVRTGCRWITPDDGPYDIRVTRVVNEEYTGDDSYSMSQTYWTALRSITYTNPVNSPVPLAVTILRVKASNELSGTVDKFSGLCSGLCPDWDAETQTWITRITQTPASHYREMLQGPQTSDPYLDEEIHLGNLEYWHEYCQTQGWKYNRIVDSEMDLDELMGEITAAGRATDTWIDYRRGVIIGEPQEFTKGPAFTPRNSSNLSSQITCPDPVHCWRCAFKNELNDYVDDERLVPADGYALLDANGNQIDAWGQPAPALPLASIFVQLPILGVTHPDLIFRHARFHWAQLQYQFEKFQFDAGVNQLVATRGDRIKFAHDVILVGLAWGRVKSLLMDSGGSGACLGAVVDAACPLQAGINYSVRFVLPNNDTLLCPVVNIVLGFQASPDWPGDQGHFIRNPRTGHLIPDDEDLAAGDNFLVFDNFVVNPYDQYVYDSEEIDLGYEATVRILTDAAAQLGPGENGEAVPGIWLQSRIAGGEYGAWQSWTAGELTGRYVKLRAVITTITGLAFLNNLRLAVDWPPYSNGSLENLLFNEQIKTLIFISPIAVGDPKPGIGDLFIFGENGKEAIDLILFAVRPKNQLGATISAVEYNEAIYAADQGVIPAHDSKITIPPEWWTPNIAGSRSDGAVLYRDNDGSWRSRILIALAIPGAIDSAIIGVEAQFWPTDSNAMPTTLPVVPLADWEVSLMPVEDGMSYDFRLRYVRQNGSRGPWTDTQVHTVAGKTAPPSDVAGFTLGQSLQFLTGSWIAVPDRDVAGYEFRFGIPGISWANGAAVQGKYNGTTFTTPNIPSGIWDIMVKAIDSSGNYSLNEARKTITVFSFHTNLATEQQAPDWSGTLVNFIRNPRTGHLIPDDQDIAAGDNFLVFDKFVVNPYAESSYETSEIDLGADTLAIAWGQIDSILGPGESGLANPEIWLKYKAEGGEYGDWQKWVLGLVQARYFKYLLINHVDVGLTVIESFQAVLDNAA